MNRAWNEYVADVKNELARDLTQKDFQAGYRSRDMEVERYQRGINDAVKMFREVKAKLGPNTTNSLIDDFLAKWGDR